MSQCHCWTDRREAREQEYEREHGAGSYFGSDPWAETWSDAWADGTCMLLEGHAGPHEFTDDRKIGVRFVPAEEQPS